MNIVLPMHKKSGNLLIGDCPVPKSRDCLSYCLMQDSRELCFLVTQDTKKKKKKANYRGMEECRQADK